MVTSDARMRLPPDTATNLGEAQNESDSSSARDIEEYGTSGSSAVGSYHELEGGTGREVNFRPPRYSSPELGPIGANVTIVLNGVEHGCVLRDVSQNGVAFEWREARAFEVGATLPLIVVSFDQHEAYRGGARVGSVRSLEQGQVVGAHFLDTLMNIDDVLHLRDVKAWSGRGPGLELKDRPWRVAGYSNFKALVGELKLFLEDAEHQLAELEGSLPWHVAHGDQASPARAALVTRLRHEVADAIVEASNAINDSLSTATPSDRQVLKEYSQRCLHSLMMQSPWMRRAREKPLGYPGDYELMNGLYANHFTGGTLFAKTLNMGIVATLAGEAVRERKNAIKRVLSALLDERRPADRPIRILSIAAGPAQETFELLEERDTVEHPVEIVLFDQDKRALAFAYNRLERIVSTRWQDRVKIVYLHDSIKRLLRDEGLFTGFGKFDAIFSCGLFDYLQPRTASSLIGNFCGNLASGGTVYVGNMTPDNPSRWFMEFHCDWYLLYRERDELIRIGRLGAPEAEVSIMEEATGINPFVTLTRP